MFIVTQAGHNFISIFCGRFVLIYKRGRHNTIVLRQKSFLATVLFWKFFLQNLKCFQKALNDQTNLCIHIVSICVVSHFQKF